MGQGSLSDPVDLPYHGASAPERRRAAASSIESTMKWYPVQRHRLPAIP